MTQMFQAHTALFQYFAIVSDVFKRPVSGDMTVNANNFQYRVG